MRKIILFIADSLDGYIAREDGDVSWLFTDQDYGYTPFLAGIDTVLMGRKTYDKLFDLGEYPYKDKKGFVFTREEGKKGEYAEFVTGDIASFTKELKESEGKDIWLVGGGEIITLFLEHRLLDEIMLFIHPIIIGRGIPLLLPSDKESILELKRTESFSSGLTLLHYEVKS